MNILFTKLILLLLVLNFYSCSPANILATGGATTMVVAEGERSLGEVVDDATIKINIAAKFISSKDNLFVNVNVTVLEGRVLLTGIVEEQEARIDAVRRVWEVKGVREVINEIETGNRDKLKDYANDLWINTQAKGLAAKTLGLRSVAYNFETINGKIFIAGISNNPESIEKLVDALKKIKGVKEIVNYVIIKE